MVGGFLLYFNLLFKKDKIDGVVGVLFSGFFLIFNVYCGFGCMNHVCVSLPQAHAQKTISEFL